MGEHIVIIGNGIAGITCARYLRKLNHQTQITVVGGETEHFFSRTALMYVYMGHMKFEHTKPYEDWFWKKNNINLVFDWVTKIDTESNQLALKNSTKLNYDKLVLATGSKPNKFGWPGENLHGVQGLYSVQDLELMEKNTANIKKAVVVGGGLIGVEMAEMLHSRGIKVDYLIREDNFWGNVLPKVDGDFIANHLKNDHEINLQFNTELEFIGGDSKQNVTSVFTSHGNEIKCDFVGLTVGVSPNIELVKQTKIETKLGVLVNKKFETNIENIYAIGDCAEFTNPVKGRKPIEQVWYTGRIMGETLAKILCGKNVEYNPGPWFNSAKFFDIEYQTYGVVPNKLEPNQNEYVWKDEKNRRLIHLVFEQETEKFLGINSFGIRLRHEIFDAWLTKGKTINYCLAHFEDANFDPEFYKAFSYDFVDAFNKKFGKSIKVKRKSWLRILNPLAS